MSPPTKVSVVKQGTVYFYRFESDSQLIEFSISEEIFEQLRLAEEQARLQSAESTGSPIEIV